MKLKIHFGKCQLKHTNAIKTESKAKLQKINISLIYHKTINFCQNKKILESTIPKLVLFLLRD